ncbi:MAG: ribokinase [Proteobacteria bacterium]|nr:ribokinase [Pseudomonadota bacterium]
MGRVLVAGSLVMDVVAGADRFPQPGETILGTSLGFYPGGKGANQALAAARSGAQTLLIGRTGKDAFGAQLREFLSGNGMDLRHVQAGEGHTGVGLIVLAQSDNSIVMVPGANSLLTPDDLSAVAIESSDIVVAQLEIPLATVDTLFRRARARQAMTIFNAAPAIAVSRDLLALADVLVVNEIELELLAGRKIVLGTNLGDVFESLAQVRTHPEQIVCATLGARGFAALSGKDRIAMEGRKVPVADTTGAGDCFVGALAARLSQGAPVAGALGFANAAASLCVQRMGAGPSMPARDEVERVL